MLMINFLQISTAHINSAKVNLSMKTLKLFTKSVFWNIFPIDTHDDRVLDDIISSLEPGFFAEDVTFVASTLGSTSR